MFTKLINRLYRSSSVWSIFVFFIFSQLLYVLTQFITFPAITSDSGHRPFDMSTFGYTESYARDFLANLSPEGTNLYLFPQLLFLDLLYPILNAIFLSLTMLLIFKKMIRKSNEVLVFGLLPLIAAVFDYLENALIVKMLVDGQNVDGIYILLANLFTLLKSITTIVCWLIIFSSIMLIIIKWLVAVSRSIMIHRNYI